MVSSSDDMMFSLEEVNNVVLQPTTVQQPAPEVTSTQPETQASTGEADQLATDVTSAQPEAQTTTGKAGNTKAMQQDGGNKPSDENTAGKKMTEETVSQAQEGTELLKEWKMKPLSEKVRLKIQEPRTAVSRPWCWMVKLMRQLPMLEMTR